MRTRLLVGGAAVALVGGLAVAALTGGDRGDGPTEQVGPHGMVVQRSLGARFTDGFEVLYLHADSPATILEVTSVCGEEALRQLGAQIAGPDREIGGIQHSRIAAREAVLVRYEVDGEEYGLEIPARLVYCPSRLPQRACERAAGRLFLNG